MLADLAAMHADEADPELMFQDWDISLAGITASELGECPDSDTLQILLDLLHASDYERELCLDFLGTGYRLSDFCSMLELYNKAEGLMVGCLNRNSWEPFRDWVEETFFELYGHEIPDSLTGYIDFDRMARDWSFDYNVGELYVYQH
jgi:antirestriction protein